MQEIIQRMKSDPEIVSLRNRYHEITGEWLGYHWDCFNGLEEYKDYMKKKIGIYEDTLKKTGNEEKAKEAMSEFGRQFFDKRSNVQMRKK